MFNVLTDMILGAGRPEPIFFDGCIVRKMIAHIEDVGVEDEFFYGELDEFMDLARARCEEMEHELQSGGGYSRFPMFQLKTASLISQVAYGDLSVHKACEQFASLRNDYHR